MVLVRSGLVWFLIAPVETKIAPPDLKAGHIYLTGKTSISFTFRCKLEFEIKIFEIADLELPKRPLGLGIRLLFCLFLHTQVDLPG